MSRFKTAFPRMIPPGNYVIGDTLVMSEENISLRRVYVYDDFDRQNGPIGSAVTGQAWNVLNGTAEVDNGLAKIASVTQDRAIAYIDVGTPNCIVDVVLAVNVLNIFIALRVQDVDNFLMLQREQPNRYALFQRSGGIFTVLSRVSAPHGNGDRLRTMMMGSNIQVFLNGTRIINVNSTAHMNQTKHGFGARLQEYATARFDNFRVEAW